jgi:hypothetical protein
VLWQHDKIAGWLTRHRKAIFACLLFALLIIASLVMYGTMQQQMLKTSATGSLPQLDSATPQQYADIPPGFFVVEDPTPTPVRRAIPVTQ